MFGPNLGREVTRAINRGGRGRISPTGPYRAQSGNAKIRAQSSPAERQDFSHGSSAPTQRARKLVRQDTRSAVKAAATDTAKATAAVSRPIQTLRRAEAKLAKAENPALRESARRLRHALASEAASKAARKTPEGEPVKANYPEPALRSVAPDAYRRAYKAAAAGGHGSSGGLKEDPAAEFAIDTAATAGLGLAARGVGFGAETAAREAAPVVKEALAGSETGAKAAVKRIASEAKGLKSSSGISSAAKRATLAGGKGAAKAIEEKLPTAERALKHPLRTNLQVTGVGGLVAPQHRAVEDRVAGAVKGEARAIFHHPGDYLKGGEKAALGFFTAPVAVAAAGVKSIATGSPAPLAATTTHLVAGVGAWMGALFSGNVKLAEKAAIEAGPTVFIPGPAIIRRLKGTSLYEDAIRGKLRDTVENRRAVKRAIQLEAEKAGHEAGRPVPKSKVKPSIDVTTREGYPTKEKYVLRRTGKKIEDQKARHEVSRIVARNLHFGEQWGLRDAGPVVKAIRESKLVGRSTRDVQNAGDAVSLIAKHGLAPDEALGRHYVEGILKGYPKAEHGDIPSGTFVDRHAAQWVLDHPQIWRDKGFWKTVDKFNEQSERIGFSERHRFLPSLRNVVNPQRAAEGLHPELAPEEMIPRDALKVLPKREKPWSRSETLDYIDAQGKTLADLRSRATKAEQSGRVHRADLKQRESAVRAREKGAYGASLTDWQRRELKAAKELERRGLATGIAPPGGHLAVVDKERPLSHAPRNLESRRAALLDANAQARGYRAEAKQLERKQKTLVRAMKGYMKPPEHGGPEHGVVTTRSTSYSAAMGEEFQKRMLAEHKRLGLKIPAAYVANHKPIAEGIGTAPDYGSMLPARSVKRSEGLAAQSGNAESSFEATLAHSIHGPRMSRAMNRAVLRVLNRGWQQIDGKKSVFTKGQILRLTNLGKVPEDIVWMRTQAVKGALSGPHPLDPLEAEAFLKGEIAAGKKLGSSSGNDLNAALANIPKGEKFTPVKGAYARELMGQVEQLPKISRGLAKLSNASTRTILNSPAFALVQIPQEGIPLLASMGKNIRHLPAGIKTVIAAHKNLDAEQVAEIKAVAGSSAGVRGAPTMRQLSSAGVMDPIRAATPKATWRHFWEVINGTKIGNLDINRAGAFREAAMAAKVQGDFKAWRKGASNIFRDEHQAIEAMKGMNREQRLAYVAAHPRLGDRLMKSMNEQIGNWNSFTAFEKQFAPATVFYSFQRFSVLWMLYHFPLNHPVATTALAWLGQSNAKTLDEVAVSEGKTITNPLQYTYPVVVNGPGKVTKNNTTVLPVGQRIAPALSTGAQALAEGKPAELTGVFQPAIQTTISAIEGKNPYTGQPLGENGFEWAARQIIAQSPIARAAGLQNAGKPGSSALSAAFEKLGDAKGLEHFVNPFTGVSGKKFATQVKLEGALKVAAENSEDKRKEAARNAAKEGKTLAPDTIKKMEARSKAAGAQISSVLRKLGLEKQDEHEFELYERNMGFGGSTNQFGIPSSSSSALRKQFGLATDSAAKLREQFGITK